MQFLKAIKMSGHLGWHKLQKNNYLYLGELYKDAK